MSITPTHIVGSDQSADRPDLGTFVQQMQRHAHAVQSQRSSRSLLWDWYAKGRLRPATSRR